MTQPGGALFLLVALLAGTGIGFLVANRWRPFRSEPSSSSLSQDADMAELSKGAKTLLDFAVDFVWRTDADQRLIRLDGSGRPRFGMAWDGRRLWELPWQPLPPREWCSLREHLTGGRAFAITLRLDGIDGSIRYFELRGWPIDGETSALGHHGVAFDISDRLRTEHALEQSRKRYQEVIESVHEVVFRTDDRLRFTYLNPAWTRCTGHAVEDSLEQRFTEFLHPDDREQTRERLVHVLAGGADDYAGQLRLPTRDGDIRWMEVTARPIARDMAPLDSGGVTEPGVVGTMNDISARRIAESTLRNVNLELESRVRMRTAELEASNRELEAFSYSVSHDLRAPLRSISGFARILEDDLGDTLTPESRDHLERIRAATGRMSQLIDNLIQLAQLPRRVLKKESVDLSALAVQVIDELRLEEPQRGVEVEITSDLVASADRELMRTVLENLLRNAWKFSVGSTPARIRFYAERDHDQRIFSVADNGIGFDMAHAANLFKPFHRLHDDPGFAGTGIGLANVQRIIERHGGRIWAESSPGSGAVFHFTLA